MRRSFAASLIAGLLLAPSLVSAQEKGDVGVTAGYPASIGLVWHASDRLAIRPEFAFSHSSNESEAGANVSEGSNTSYGIGVSALFYLRKWDRVQTYVAPRYTYTRSTSESDSTFSSPSESETDSHGFAGYFGVQYAPHQRFAVFGEVGGGVTRSSGRIVGVDTESRSTTVSTRTGVGVIFYF